MSRSKKERRSKRRGPPTGGRPKKERPVVHHHHHFNLLGNDLEARTTTKVGLGYDGQMYQAPGILPVAKCFFGCILCPLATLCCLFLLLLVGVKWICVFVPSLC